MAQKTENAKPQEQDVLSNFGFDNEESFFGIEAEGEEAETTKVVKAVKAEADIEDEDDEAESLDKKKAPKAEDKKSKAKAEDEEDKEEDKATFFGDEKETKKGEAKTDSKTAQAEEDKDEPADDKFFTTLAEELKEKGIFSNIELPENEVITEEKFFELQDAEIEARVEETFESFFEEMDEEGKAFLKFKKNKGTTAEFLTVYGTTLDLPEFDDTDENQRQQVLEYFLMTAEGLDAEETADRIAWLKEHGKDKSYATKYYNSIKKTEDAAKEKLQKDQEIAAKNREDNAKKFNKSLEDTLKKTDKVGAFEITKDDREKLLPYITKPTVKVGKNKYVPAFQNKMREILSAQTPESIEKLLIIAKLVNSDFDVSSVATKVKTQVTKEVQSRLKAAKEGGVNASTSGNYGKKSLADFID